MAEFPTQSSNRPETRTADADLRSELLELDAAQKKLDSLLVAHSQDWKGSKGMAACSGSGFVFDLDLGRFFAAWRAVSEDVAWYKRRRRDKASRLWLQSRVLCQFFWSLVSNSLQRFVEKPLPLPSKLTRGMRCRQKQSQRSGTFLSSSEKGICKVVFDGEEEPTLIPAASLVQVCIVSHPFLAGLAFLAWALAHAQHEDLKMDSLRTALMFNQVMGKSDKSKVCSLAMLAVMQEEEQKGVRFTFMAWKKLIKSSLLRTFRVKRQRFFFRAWLETFFMDKHDYALELLGASQAQSKREIARRVSREEDLF